MSLILEALKKLDREKQAPERGVLVLGATAWAARSEGRSRLWRFLLADLLLVGLGGALVYFWLRASATPPAPAAAGLAASRPSAAPVVAITPLPPPSSTPLPPERPARPAATPAPVEPPAAAPARGTAAFVLQAVTEQDGQPVAMISERLLRAGEGFDGMRVVRITPTEVEIEIEATGERRTLAF